MGTTDETFAKWVGYIKEAVDEYIAQVSVALSKVKNGTGTEVLWEFMYLCTIPSAYMLLFFISVTLSLFYIVSVLVSVIINIGIMLFISLIYIMGSIAIYIVEVLRNIRKWFYNK